MDLVTSALVDAGEFRHGAGFGLMYYPDEDHMFTPRYLEDALPRVLSFLDSHLQD